MVDRELRALILRSRGDNRKLAESVVELLPADAKLQLYRLLQDAEHEQRQLRQKATNFTHAVRAAIGGMR